MVSATGSPVRGGAPEVAGERVAHVRTYCTGERLVQPVLRAGSAASAAGSALLAGQGAGRVAGQRADAGEDHDRRPGQRHHRLDQPAQQIAPTAGPAR